MAGTLRAVRSEPPPTNVPPRSASDLLGGTAVLGREVASAIDAHELLKDGLPSEALEFLGAHLVHIPAATAVATAAGMSVRTFHRHKASSSKRLSREQSGHAWTFAEVLVRAIRVFGSQLDAEKWLDAPAIGLDQRRPLDLLGTPAGVTLVEDYLDRMEFGVYA